MFAVGDKVRVICPMTLRYRRSLRGAEGIVVDINTMGAYATFAEVREYSIYFFNYRLRLVDQEPLQLELGL